MNKLIAIPVSNGLLDAHFGHCKEFALLEIADGKVTNELLLGAPPHEPDLLPRFLTSKGVTDVIAGGMGNKAIQLFKQAGVNVFVGAPQISAGELVEGFINQSIQFNANYCDH
ncbi:MAG: ATPase [Prolixibacteraceae bacterium]|jgi:predicted Fe-Mo cluster-binding NifX family protein|nr:ATPase [Prolixibacteraceae bacterium]